MTTIRTVNDAIQHLSRQVHVMSAETGGIKQRISSLSDSSGGADYYLAIEDEAMRAMSTDYITADMEMMVASLEVARIRGMLDRLPAGDPATRDLQARLGAAIRKMRMGEKTKTRAAGTINRGKLDRRINNMLKSPHNTTILQNRQKQLEKRIQRAKSHLSVLIRMRKRMTSFGRHNRTGDAELFVSTRSDAPYLGGWGTLLALSGLGFLFRRRKKRRLARARVLPPGAWRKGTRFAPAPHP
ncbi:MAG: hypothetical protein U9N14_06615 [Pseudomonadota bacterium]|nr:hypothetical protein [Pseudomonadota bacterium]